MNSFKLLGCTIMLMMFAVSCDNNNTDTTTITNNSDTNPDAIEVTGCASLSGIDKIVCLSNTFKSQLDASQLATAQRSYSTTEAKKWSNFPESIYGQRIGLSFGSMTSTQIQYAKALLKAVASEAAHEGYNELQELLNADEYLQDNGGGSGYGAANYFIALLGSPASTGTFEIQFGGHHLAFANTYKEGVLTGATPSFRGVEPFGDFQWNGKTNQPLNGEKDALSAMLTALSSAQLLTAKLTGTYSDLVAGPQKDGSFPSTPSGIKVSELSADQKALVLNAITTYVSDIADASEFVTRYTNELDNTYISYSGTTGVATTNDYVRIDGPSVWIEYSAQRGVILSGTHPHSVWRDKSTDYGGN
jgi:hypothetical protein